MIFRGDIMTRKNHKNWSLKGGNLELKRAIYGAACMLDLEYLVGDYGWAWFEFGMSYLRQNMWDYMTIFEIYFGWIMIEKALLKVQLNSVIKFMCKLWWVFLAHWFNVIMLLFGEINLLFSGINMEINTLHLWKCWSLIRSSTNDT